MRTWIIWVGVLATGPANAEPPASKAAASTPEAQVEALVRRNLAGITKRCREPTDCAVDVTTVAYDEWSGLGLEAR
jgi:hypothetical protein